MTKQLLFLVCSILVTGCATSPDMQRDALISGKLCCSGYVDLPLSGRLETEQTIEIGTESPLFAFPGGRSFFAMLSLPERVRGRTLILRTIVGSPTITSGGGAHLYLYPAVTFLSASREPIVTVHDEKLIPELFGWSGTGSFVGKVQVPGTAAYAIIHTLPAKLGELYVGYVKSAGFTTIAGGTLISQGGGIAPVRAVFSSTGKIMVSITP